MNTAPQTSDPRVTDIVRAGRLRAALFPPQYQRDPETGELRGVWVEVVRALGEHIGVETVVLELATPADMIGRLAAGHCDVASLGYDPARVAQVGGFTSPFMRVDYSYLVPAHSGLRTVGDADRTGLRIAAVRDHASTLALLRILKHAEAIDVQTPDAAFALLQSGRVDAWASIRPTLLHHAPRWPGSRVLDGSYGANFPALIVPKGHAVRLAYVSEFIEHAKASGLIQRAIDRAGQPGYQVASEASQR